MADVEETGRNTSTFEKMRISLKKKQVNNPALQTGRETLGGRREREEGGKDLNQVRNAITTPGVYVGEIDTN